MCRGNSLRRGVTLVELMVALGIFGLLTVLLFTLFQRGTTAVALANAKHQAQLSLNKTPFWLERDLAETRPSQLNHKRVGSPGNGDALWFLSANDPTVTDLDTRYQREESTGTPIPQANILYYLIRPGNYSKVSNGMTPGIDPDPLNDFYAPHKFLIRKIIDRTPGDPDTPELLLTSAEVDSYLTAPDDYNLASLGSEGNVEEVRIIADKMLSFEVSLDQTVLRVNSSALKIDEARKSIPQLGNVSLRNHPLTTHRQARFILRK